jgi:hypothetical protein
VRVELRNNVVCHNTASGWGGGMYLREEPSIVANNVVYGNSADLGDSGGIGLRGAPNTVVRGNTIVANHSTIDGANLDIQFSDNVTVTNNIIADALSSAGVYFYSSSVDFEYNDVWNNEGGDYVGLPDQNGIQGNISVDPFFSNADANDYHLQPTSPCINAGDPNYLAEPGETDMDGQSRVVDARIDMGADEVAMFELTVLVVGAGTVDPNSGSYFAGTVVTLTAMPGAGYVVRQWAGTDDDTSCAPTNTVTMDSDTVVTVEFGLPHVFVVPGEYNTIPEAIDAAACGDVIVVNSGLWPWDIQFNGKNIMVTSTNPDDPCVVAWTVLQGSGTGPVVTFSGSETQDCVLDGLTITGGNTPGDGGGVCGNRTEATIASCVITGNHADGYGGGISDCDGAILRCTITGNTAGAGGGGISVIDCNVTVTDCDISYNAAAHGGGLCCIDSPGMTITRCTISDNDANTSETAYGGGISVFGSPIVIEDCLISRNSAAIGGGGLHLAGSTGSAPNGIPQVRQCLITENTAGEEGGGISCAWYAEPIITNCTIADNTVTDGYGGGLCCWYESHATVINSILWANAAMHGPQIAVATDLPHSFPSIAMVPLPSIATISYSDAKGGQGAVYVEPGCTLNWGSGSIASNPMFVDPNVDDYHLGAGSPCIDAGDNNSVPPSVVTDLDGNARIINGVVDMGPYENTYFYVDGINGDDNNDGRSPETAFATIQKGIDTAEDGCVVLVFPAEYLEPDPWDPESINFLGKNIKVTSAEPGDWDIVESTVIRGIVLFDGSEDANCVFTGFTVRDISNGAIYGNDRELRRDNQQLPDNG